MSQSAGIVYPSHATSRVGGVPLTNAVTFGGSEVARVPVWTTGPHLVRITDVDIRESKAGFPMWVFIMRQVMYEGLMAFHFVSFAPEALKWTKSRLPRLLPSVSKRVLNSKWDPLDPPGIIHSELMKWKDKIASASITEQEYEGAIWPNVKNIAAVVTEWD